MRKVWCMNLKDNRATDRKNKDSELKFRLCVEKEIIAIGWSVPEVINSWQEYLAVADKFWGTENEYIVGTNAIKEMAYGDLVWVKNPVNDEFYIAEILDKAHDPSIYSNLTEFDICAYRKCRFFYVKQSHLIDELCKKNLVARHAIERISPSRQNTIDATNALFDEIRRKTNETF